MDNLLLDHLEILRHASVVQLDEDTDELVIEALEAIFSAIDDDDNAANAGSIEGRSKFVLLAGGLVEVVTELAAIDGHSPFVYHRCFSILATLVVLDDDEAKLAHSVIRNCGGIQAALQVARKFSAHESLLWTVMSFFYFMTKTDSCVSISTALSSQISARVLDCMRALPEVVDVFSFGCAILLNLCLHKEGSGCFLQLRLLTTTLATGVAWFSWDADVQVLGRELLLITAGEAAATKLIENAEMKLNSAADCSAAA